MVWDDIKGGCLEFDEETHTYIYEGVILPSVTQVLKCKFGNMYDYVRADVLQKAGERGTKIHSDIEAYIKGEDRDTTEVRGFKFLQKQYDLSPLSSEIPVVIFLEGKPKIAGRLDMLLDIGDKLALADVKTTSTLNKEYLTYQLNLYRIGFDQCFEMDIEKLFGIHLREHKRKLVEIPINEPLALQIIKEYERGSNE